MRTHSQGFDTISRTDRLMARFGHRVAAALAELQTRQPRHDIDERLRFAREQALARARESRLLSAEPALALGAGGAATLVVDSGSGEDGGAPWWLRLSSLLPLAVLLAGLVLIDHRYTRSQIEAAAEVDAALLADDLPPEAYSDPGFVEYLKTARP
jgi:hypothetical protein